MSRLALFLLGPPRVECDGKPVQLDRRKAFALIAYLAVRGQSHTRDSLATMLWPEHSQSQARAGLRRALAALKADLGEGWLDVDRQSVSLKHDANIYIDVSEFEDWLAECHTHGHYEQEVCPACLHPLTEAILLYRDDFLTGFTLRDSPGFDEWQFFQTECLRQEFANALDRLAQAYTSQGAYERAIVYARRWLSLDPLHEPAHRYLMRLYAESGQRVAAFRQYEECERVFQEELGVSPEEETVQLHQAIKDGQDLPAVGDRFVTPVEHPSTARKHNLPIQLTPFVGREAELVNLGRLLADPHVRLVTIIGPGGMGKTRLALEAARAEVDRTDRRARDSSAASPVFANGVYFVSLAHLDSSGAIVPAVAEALDFTFYEDVDPQQQLLDYLRQKCVLLVMDNFEHMLGGVGWVIDMLENAPGVKILATSRSRLNVQGEHLFPLTGLDFPAASPMSPGLWSPHAPQPSGLAHAPTDQDVPVVQDIGQYSAVKLFLEAARRVRPSFELTTDNLSHVIQICHLVQGMPLAILLAAAWVEMLTPAEIVTEIGKSLDLLETDLRDVPARQRSIQAIFDHSWNLLTEREREVFQRLSVFLGSFTREAAREITGASLRELLALVNKSLLHRASTGRFEMHKLLRQCAAQKLDKSPVLGPFGQEQTAGEAVHDQHCAYYATALQRWEAILKSAQQQVALEEIETDIENARAAWNWAIKRGQVARLEQAIEGLCLFYEWRGRFQEGELVCRAAAETLDAMKCDDSLGAPLTSRLRVLIKALTWQSNFKWLLGSPEAARKLLRKSLTLLEDPALAGEDTRLEEAFVLRQMGHVVRGSNREEARRLFEQSLELCQTLGDRWATAIVLDSLGAVTCCLGSYAKAKELLEESLAIRQAMGDRRGIASSLMLLGTIAMGRRQLEEGKCLVQESIEIRRDIGDRAGVAGGLTNLGTTLLSSGDYSEGHSLLKDGAAIFDEIGFRRGLAFSSISLGEAKMHLGQYEDARVQGQLGLALSREIGYSAGIGFSCDLLGYVALAAEEYTQALQLFRESIAIYREIGQREDMGWALVGSGYAARGLGDLHQAQQHFYETLKLAIEIGTLTQLLWALPGIALLLTDQGDADRAIELYALASRYPNVAHSNWFEDVAGRHITAIATALPRDVISAARTLGQNRDLDVTLAELFVELGG